MIANDIGCMRCPAQREPLGCTLRIYRHQIIDKLTKELRDEISFNEARNEEIKAKIAEIEKL